MIIRRLTLKNYRRFRSLDLELPENIIGILGSNGSGKTTIVESIGWCLYGNRIRRTDKQDIRSQFCSAGDVTAVTLEFDLQGESYRIERELRGKAATVEAAIYRGDVDEPIAVQERGVNEMVEKLLNLDYRSFFVSVFARQKDLAALSMFRPEERKKSIARLINIDAIERARKNVRTDKNIKNEKKSGIEAHLADEKELTAKKKELQRELKEADIEIEKKKKQFSAVRKELSDLKAEFESQSKKREQFLQLSSQIENKKNLKQEFESREKQLEKEIEQILSAKKEYEEQKGKLKEFEKVQRKKERMDRDASRFSALQAYQQEFKRVEAQVTREKVRMSRLISELKDADAIREHLEKTDARIAKLKERQKQLQKTQLENQGQLKSIETKGKEARQRKNKIEELGPESPCPVCTRPLKDHYEKVLGQFNAELLDLAGRYREVEKAKEAIVAEIQDVEDQLKKLNEERDALLQNREEFRQRKKQRDESEKELVSYQKQLKEIEERIAKLGTVEYNEKIHIQVKKDFKELYQIRDRLLRHEENIKRLEQTREELTRVQMSLAQYAAEIKQETKKMTELGYDAESFEKTRNVLDEKQKELDELNEEIHQLEQRKIAITKDIEHLTADIEKNSQLREQISQAQNEITYLEALDYHFGIFRQELSGRIRPMIAARASELLHLTTQGKYSILELDEDYNIFLYDQAERFPLARFSGGEEDLANLCLRIAISQVVAERSGRSQINFIVLDEIFGSQDEHRRELIMNALQQLATQFRQIFIITHVENIKDSLPVVIFVREKSLLESEAVLV
ncbi:hypothetical protein B6D60_09280 [candidate division KSB1 bacterium 4484_87]|nr:MAG: hypothetical protein B6D60_09280 [candidate division KSB1 bacterium 4484_87]